MEAEDHPRETRMAASPRTSADGCQPGTCTAGAALGGASAGRVGIACAWVERRGNANRMPLAQQCCRGSGEHACFRDAMFQSSHVWEQTLFGTVMFRSSHVSEQSMSRNSHGLERSCFGSGRHASLTTHAPCSVSRHPCEQSCFGGWREQPCADLVSSHLSEDGVTSHVV